VKVHTLKPDAVWNIFNDAKNQNNHTIKIDEKRSILKISLIKVNNNSGNFMIYKFHVDDEGERKI
jgi:CRISPR/Cas system CSM-associated protein Csm4 (group 5 of RAMP superfamily)